MGKCNRQDSGNTFPKVILKKLERYQKDTIDYQTDEKQFHYHKFVEDTKPFRIPQNVKTSRGSEGGSIKLV